MSNEKIVGGNPFSFLDAWNTSVASGNVGAIVLNLQDVDEALVFLENHPRPQQLPKSATLSSKTLT